MLLIADIVVETVVEGPGKRLAIWVQGCEIRCPGCCNPRFFSLRRLRHTQDQHSENSLIKAALSATERSLAVRLSELFKSGPCWLSVQQICTIIDQSLQNSALQGVSFLGGEPFTQAGGLASIGRYAGGLGLSVMVFTGHTLEQLCSRSGWQPPDRIELAATAVDAANDPFWERLERLVAELDPQAVLGLLEVCDLLVDGPYLRELHQRDRRWIGSANQQLRVLSQRGKAELEGESLSTNHLEIRLVNGALSINGFPIEDISWLR